MKNVKSDTDFPVVTPASDDYVWGHDNAGTQPQKYAVSDLGSKELTDTATVVGSIDINGETGDIYRKSWLIDSTTISTGYLAVFTSVPAPLNTNTYVVTDINVVAYKLGSPDGDLRASMYNGYDNGLGQIDRIWWHETTPGIAWEGRIDLVDISFDGYTHALVTIEYTTADLGIWD